MSSRKATFETTIRILKLALMMDQRRTAWAVADVAERFEISTRTVTRYIEDVLGTVLVDADGGPILVIEHQGQTPFIVAKGPVFSFNVEIFDYASLFLSMRLLDFAKDTRLREGLERIADGMRPLLPSSRMEVLARFSKKFTVFHTGNHRAVDNEMMADMISGLINERRLAIRYHKWAKAKVVEPLTLTVYKEGLYLVVRLPGKPNPFMLSVPLIKELEYLTEKFVMPKDWSPESMRAGGFGLFPGQPVPIELAFQERLFDYLQNRVFHPSQTVTRNARGEVLFTMAVGESPELVAWICAFGDEVEVRSPATLRTAVAARLTRAASIYAKKPATVKHKPVLPTRRKTPQPK